MESLGAPLGLGQRADTDDQPGVQPHVHREEGRPQLVLVHSA